MYVKVGTIEISKKKCFFCNTLKVLFFLALPTNLLVFYYKICI